MMANLKFKFSHHVKFSRYCITAKPTTFGWVIAEKISVFKIPEGSTSRKGWEPLP